MERDLSVTDLSVGFSDKQAFLGVGGGGERCREGRNYFGRVNQNQGDFEIHSSTHQH